MDRIGRALGQGHTRLVRQGLLPGHRHYRPFVIVSRARSGSNLLVSLLGSHPQIDARGELLKRLAGESAHERVASIYGRQPRRILAAGCKCFYYHPLDDREAPIWDALRAVPGLHVVHLTRRNVLRTITSRRLADLTGTWLERGASSDPATSKPRVTLTAAQLVAEFEQQERWVAQCADRFHTHPLHEVAYEDLAADPATLDGVVRFLGVEPQPLASPLRRQNPEPLRDLIVGYDVLRGELADTRWAPYFADD